LFNEAKPIKSSFSFARVLYANKGVRNNIVVVVVVVVVVVAADVVVVVVVFVVVIFPIDIF